MASRVKKSVDLDRPLTLVEAIGVLSRPVAYRTMVRWATVGVRGGYRLYTWFEGGRRYTTRRKIEEFSQTITRAANGSG